MTKTRKRSNKLGITLDPEFQAFLDIQKGKTKSTYAGHFRYWVKFTGMNGKETLEFRKKSVNGEVERKVLAFHEWMIEHGKSEATAKASCGAVRGFFASNRLGLVFNRSESKRINEANRKTSDYKFSREDLAKMSEHAPLFPDKYVVLVGKSLGLRAGDFLNLTYGMFRSIHLDEPAPVFIGVIPTGKEKVPAYSFLDSDSVPIIKAILEANKDKKDTDEILEFTDENTLSQIMKRLFEKAGLVSGDKVVRFHELRSYLSDRLSAICAESQWKQIVGKKIAEGAYITSEQLRDIYTRAMPNIVVNTNGNGETKKKVSDLEKQNETLRTILISLLGKDRIESALGIKPTIETKAPSETVGTERIVGTLTDDTTLYEVNQLAKRAEKSGRGIILRDGKIFEVPQEVAQKEEAKIMAKPSIANLDTGLPRQKLDSLMAYRELDNKTLLEQFAEMLKTQDITIQQKDGQLILSREKVEKELKDVKP